MPIATLLPRVVLAATLALAPASASRRHELPDNRATLVLRDGTHLSVTFYLNYVDVLHRALAPKQPLGEFLVMYSALKPAAFRQQMQEAQARLQSAIRVTPEGGKELPLAGWKWPEPFQVQALIQQAAMQAVVAPNDHVNEPQSEIQAELVAERAISAVTVRFPPAFLRVLVVSYRPTQRWVEPQLPSPRITF
jgi:hypothetical protein